MSDEPRDNPVATSSARVGDAESDHATTASPAGDAAASGEASSAASGEAGGEPTIDGGGDASREGDSGSVPVQDAGDGSGGATEPEPLLEVSAELKAIVEALVFASPEPLTPRLLGRLLAEEPAEDVAAALAAIAAEYASRPGLQMVEVAGGYQIVTRPELHEWVRRLFHERSTQKLSVQALETLAVIAYKQPVTALEVAEIRGVNTSGVLSTLLERHLIKIVGRKNVVGRPFLYATTKEFLIRFGLNDLGDLPRVEDMAEALGFDPPAGLIEQTPRDEVLPLGEEDAPAADEPE
jgi:segregation and condensation protein B